MKRWILVCLSVALAIGDILGGSRLANAGSIIIEVNDGAGWEQVAIGSSSGGPINGTYTTADKAFTITAIASSNSPGTDPIGKLLSATLSVINNTSSKDELLLAIGAQDFTKPVTPPPITLNSHIGGSVVTASDENRLSFQSWVDTGNRLGHLGTAGPLTPGPQTVNAKKNSFKDDADTLISSLSATYSITQGFDIKLGGGSEINFSANTTLTPSPEPASIILFGFGAAGMWGLRRKWRQPTA